MPLQAGDRINLIRRLSSKLAELEWSDLDLTLRQFGLPWSNEWQSSRYDYAIHHLEDGDEEVLLNLYEHLIFGGSVFKWRAHRHPRTMEAAAVQAVPKPYHP
jgi:hypothetical protein